ncbi:hypothetical protein GCM10020367_15390 [Streptomyces sannanensis]|uniref:Lipoprotein n=1 Tax=Streptomyces sannanensis TaxID=285536 RepID=A0ABP6S7H8_9ACTN
MYVSGQRRLRVALGAVLLTLGIAGCSTNRTAVGTLTYTTEAARIVTVSNPYVSGCHHFGPAGATTLANRTLVDILVYTNRTCQGREAAYVATSLSDLPAPRYGPWRSYSFVH